MADINGDGKPDLAVANGNYSSTTVSVLLGGGAVVIDLSVTATSVATTEGAAFSGRVATFSDGSNTDPIGNFTATIHWGDSTSDTAGTVSQPGGIGTAYVVAASGTPHTYAEEGPYTFSVTITDTDETSNTASNTGTATVADAALTGSSAATAGGTEGILNSSVLSGATFTDANPGDHSAEMSATINWKDTQTSIGTVSYLDGVYTVHGAHTYAEEGSFGFSIDVVDAGGSGTTITGTATVADAALTAGTLTPPAATEGARFNDVVVFHFTDADPGGAVGDYLATVNTGDVTLNNVFNPTQVAIVANGEGGFDVLLSYNYLEELTGATFSVTVTDNAATTSQSIDTFSVADAALTAKFQHAAGHRRGAVHQQGVHVQRCRYGRRGQRFHSGGGPGRRQHRDPDQHGERRRPDRGWQGRHVRRLRDTHLPGRADGPDVQRHCHRPFQPDERSTSTFSVADAALTGGTQAAAGGTENATNSSVLSAATFTDANPGDNHAEMTATINWGDDGDTSPGTVSFAGGVYTVNGTHTYAEEGSHGLSISVVDNGGSVATISGTATVADAALTANSFTPPVAIEGAPVDGTVFNFSDADPNGTVSDYTAVVVLGDGTTVTLTSVPSSDGQIVANGVTFDVQLSHTYLEELTGQTFRVTVTDNASQAGAATTTFSVADAASTMDSFTPPAATEGIPIGGGPRGFFFLPFRHGVPLHRCRPQRHGHRLHGDGVLPGDGIVLTSTAQSEQRQIVANGRGFDVNADVHLPGGDDGRHVQRHGHRPRHHHASTSTFSVADAPLTTNSFTPPVATEGAPFSGTVLNFSDADPNGTASDYTAVVDLGDGNTVILTSNFTADGQIVPHVGGTFDVRVTHTYLEEALGQTFSVTVTDHASQTSASTNFLNVADAALAADSLTPPVASEGTPFSGTVFNFSDADPYGTASDYTAVVVLGDGSTVTLTSTVTANGQIVAHAGGTFDVNLTHTYLEEITGQTFSVTVTDNQSQASGSTSLFSVADAALTAGVFTPPVATEGAAFSGTVFNFREADPNGTASDYTAVVVLGDGSTVTLTSTFSADGQIVAHAGGTFDVNLTHTYLEELTGKSFSVTVTDNQSQTSASTNTFSVADAALTTNSFTPPLAIEGIPFADMVVLNFSDADPNGTASDYTAVVVVGDGDTVTLTSTPDADGQIVAHAGGTFDVQLTHTYLEEMTGRPFSVTVTDNLSQTSARTSAFRVADAALTTNTFTPPVVTESAAFSGTVLNFSDADPNGTLSDYTATVVLGDGNTVILTNNFSADGQIVPHVGGTFDVRVTHTYLEEVTGQAFSVSVTDHNATTARSLDTFSVADAALASNPSNLTPPAATEGVAFSNVVVFHFTDADPSGTATDYVATVNTGNATLTSTLNPDNVTIVANNGGFDVQLSYAYSEEMTNATFGVSVADHNATTSPKHQHL